MMILCTMIKRWIMVVPEKCTSLMESVKLHFAKSHLWVQPNQALLTLLPAWWLPGRRGEDGRPAPRTAYPAVSYPGGGMPRLHVQPALYLPRKCIDWCTNEATPGKCKPHLDHRSGNNQTDVDYTICPPCAAASKIQLLSNLGSQ